MRINNYKSVLDSRVLPPTNSTSSSTPTFQNPGNSSPRWPQKLRSADGAKQQAAKAKHTDCGPPERAESPNLWINNLIWEIPKISFGLFHLYVCYEMMRCAKWKLSRHKTPNSVSKGLSSKGVGTEGIEIWAPEKGDGGEVMMLMVVLVVVMMLMVAVMVMAVVMVMVESCAALATKSRLQDQQSSATATKSAPQDSHHAALPRRFTARAQSKTPSRCQSTAFARDVPCPIRCICHEISAHRQEESSTTRGPWLLP